MIFSTHDIVLWAINIGLNVCLVFMTWDKARFWRWPIFRLFIQASLLKSTLLVAVSLIGNDHLYFCAYWTVQVILFPFYFGIVFETFADLFRPFWTVPRIPMIVLQAAIALVSVGAITLAVLFPGHYNDRLLGAFHRYERSVLAVICAALGFVALFARYFRMPWRFRTAGIAGGLALFALLRTIGLLIVRVDASIPVLLVLRKASLYSYLVTQAFWVVVCIRTRKFKQPSIAIDGADRKRLRDRTEGLVTGLQQLKSQAKIERT
jgi:hypothetical protein